MYTEVQKHGNKEYDYEHERYEYEYENIGDMNIGKHYATYEYMKAWLVDTPDGGLDSSPSGLTLNDHMINLAEFDSKPAGPLVAI